MQRSWRLRREAARRFRSASLPSRQDVSGFGEVDKVLLWRVIYTRRVTLQSDSFCSGPWHPDKAYVEQLAARLRRTMPVGLQSNRQALVGACTWLAQN